MNSVFVSATLVVLLPILLQPTQADLCSNTTSTKKGTCSDIQDGVGLKCSCFHVFPANLTEPNKIKILDLSDNFLDEIVSVPYLFLTVLDLNHNSIKVVHDKAFKGCASLNQLDLGRNQISELTVDVFMELDKLTHLILDYNNLRNLTEPGVFMHIKQHLKSLDLSHNHLTVIGDNVINNLRELTGLNLAGNNLESVPHLAGLTALEALDLSSNHIEKIEANSFKDLKELTELLLNGNKIVEIRDHAFDGLDKLETLNLEDNEIGALNANSFKDLPALKVLNLNRNLMGYIEAGGLPSSLEQFSMTELKASEGMTMLPRDMFKGVRNLKTLRISNTKIEEIKEEAFDHSGRIIETVDLSGNQLTTVGEDILMWANITNLYLSDNPWNCDCKLAWMRETIPHVAQNITCVSPEQFKGRKLSEVELTKDDCVIKGHASHRTLFVAVTIITLIMVAATILLAIMYHFRKRAARYKTLREDRGGSVQFNSAPRTESGPAWLEEGAIQYRPNNHGNKDRGAREEMIRADDDNTLFSID